MRPCFVLVHSPSVGPATWTPVARVLGARAYTARVPDLTEACTGDPPFWPNIVEAVLASMADVGAEQSVVLVAHSNAGLFLPVIRQAIRQPVVGCVLVDAPLPVHDGETPVAAAELLAFLRPLADGDGRLPRWTEWWDETDVAPMFPDPASRTLVSDEQPRLPLAYYEQLIPAPAGWDDGPISYVAFGPPYDVVADEAQARGYLVHHLPGAHLHQIVDPDRVADILLTVVRR